MATSAIAGRSQVNVIYGEDNRVDVVDSAESMFVELARSTAAMIPHTLLTAGDKAEFELGGRSLKSRGMCETERFINQPTVATCSGFLVGEDLLVTAGHCIRHDYDCEMNSWVFDYKVENEFDSKVVVRKENAYQCKKIITRDLNESTKHDYALIQLDRKVLDRRILKTRKSGRVTKGDKLVVIGHPTGLPTKIADGAMVRSLKNTYFQTDLDTYSGNSGSAVFNATTGLVEGILVRGEPEDYIYDQGRQCQVSNVLPQHSGRGEDVAYITNIKELLKL